MEIENRVTWFELPADDVQRASSFYTRVFGWNIQGGMIDTSNGQNASPNVSLPGSINGHIAQKSEISQHPKIVIKVKDIDQTITDLKAAGGSVLLEKTEIPGIDMAFATVQDTEGNLFNITSGL